VKRESVGCRYFPIISGRSRHFDNAGIFSGSMIKFTG